MFASLPDQYSLSPEIVQARRNNIPIVALETTVITHGLPFPENINLALDMDKAVRSQGAVPAAIGVIQGRIQVGMTEEHLDELVNAKDLRKVSSRDFSAVLANGASGGTTVAGTLVVAHQLGIRVFATGGIGGVHRDAPYDVSADLPELAKRQVLVVCAGAKAILDLSATTEYLETIGVPVLGYGTDSFPAFYSRESKYKVSQRVDSLQDIVDIAQIHWQMGLTSAVLVTVPPPGKSALSNDEIEAVINQAQQEAEEAGIRGQELTPFLLSRISELTNKASLRTNLDLLLNNAKVASQLAVELNSRNKKGIII